MLRQLSLFTLLASAYAGPAFAQYAWVEDPASGHWYSLTQTTGGWEAAQAEAEGLGGYLAVIGDAAEDSFLWGQFGSTAVMAHGPWIGLFQDRADGSFAEPGGGWKWVNGEALSYTNWGFSEPNNSGGAEDYGHYHGPCCAAQTWNDAPEGLFGGLWGIIEVEFDPTAGPLLSVSGLVGGGAATVTVSGAMSSATISVAYSLRGAGPTTVAAGACGILSVELTAPTLLFTGTTDVSGTLSFASPSIPPSATGLSLWLDAVDTGACTSSNGLALIVG